MRTLKKLKFLNSVLMLNKTAIYIILRILIELFFEMCKVRNFMKHKLKV